MLPELQRTTGLSPSTVLAHSFEAVGRAFGEGVLRLRQRAAYEELARDCEAELRRWEERVGPLVGRLGAAGPGAPKSEVSRMLRRQDATERELLQTAANALRECAARLL